LFCSLLSSTHVLQHLEYRGPLVFQEAPVRQAQAAVLVGVIVEEELGRERA
jgi:hypothetical protein